MADPKPVLEYRQAVRHRRYVVMPGWLVVLHRLCCNTGDIPTVIYAILFWTIGWVVQAVLGLFGCELVTQKQMDGIIARQKAEPTSSH